MAWHYHANAKTTDLWYNKTGYLMTDPVPRVKNWLAWWSQQVDITKHYHNEVCSISKSYDNIIRHSDEIKCPIRQNETADLCPDEIWMDQIWTGMLMLNTFTAIDEIFRQL
jgi:hypothetical protein